MLSKTLHSIKYLILLIPGDLLIVNKAMMNCC